MVAVMVEKREPAVLVRERVHLVRHFTYESRQPYHTAAKLDLEEARAFVAHIRKEACALAREALKNVGKKLEEHGYKLDRGAILLAAGRPLPPLPKILAAHSLIHTADGELFREAILDACARCGLRTGKIRERELLAAAAKTLRLKANDVTRRIAALGGRLGPPWSQDEKLAALVAWFAIAGKR
jgi:hypothetical protein